MVKPGHLEKGDKKMYERVALVVLDGVGIGKHDKGDMVYNAYTPTLSDMLDKSEHVKLQAHGTAVGLAGDADMGNSEVGHNALGCGQIIPQGAKLVDEAVKTESIFHTPTWNKLVNNCKEQDSTMHFIGLLSDGNVHSNISHLLALISRVKQEGIKNCRIHILLDGRDVPSDSSLHYIDMLEQHLNKVNDQSFFACIASGGGRMVITMDRYCADWGMVKKGWDTHVHGEGRQFESASEAVLQFRKEGCASDQYIPPFVIAKNGKPMGRIEDNDSVILFNFRGDRAIELSLAFDKEEFEEFDRGRRPKVCYAGMLQYDGDLKIPSQYLVDPPVIMNTLTDVLCKEKISEYAVSETQKYGHVTYFWNGNRSGKTSEEYEEYEEIASDNSPFDERPWMKAGEIADRMIKAIEGDKYRFLRCNFPNGDMVGHTGNLDATRLAVECVDYQLGRIREACRKNKVLLMVVADHGNADEMIETKNGEEIIRTAHSLNPVWFIVDEKEGTFLKNEGHWGLANVAPTILEMFGIERPSMWESEVFMVAEKADLS